MARMRIFWNYVTANQDTHLDALVRSTPPDVARTRRVAPGCVGVLFRSVLSEDPDFSQFLSEMTLEQYRRARNEPDNSLLFKAKPQDQKSIATLRIVRPDRFSQLKGQVPGGFGKLSFPIEVDVRFSRFEVLLESTEFILEDVQEQMAERFQLQETFGNFNVFFFGKRAEIFTYSGTLFNACSNLQWRNQFLDNYENFLRGTKCAQLRARAYLLYDDVVREGFILSAGLSQNSTVESAVKFNFTLLVTGKRILGEIPAIRTGKVVNSASTKNAPSGITEFQFSRAIDPELPMVGESSVEDVLNIAVLEQGPLFAFSVNNAMPGDEPSSDLKQVMINKSLDALNAYRGQGQATEAGTLDHDILIDFIDRDFLPRTASLLAAGVKTVDTNNLKGREAVLLLTSSALTIEELTLKDAVAAAESFSTEFASAIGGESGIAGDLGLLANHLKRDSKCRIATPVPASGGTALTVDWAKVKDLKKGCEGKSFVLDASADAKLLTTLISETEAIRTFDINAANASVVNELTVSALKVFLANKSEFNSARLIRLYAASFCLITNPNTNQLFPEIQALANSSTLGGKPNALQYVDSLKLGALTVALSTLPASVQSVLATASSGIASCGLMSTIVARTGVSAELVPLNEELLGGFSSFTGFGAEAPLGYTRFVFSLSVYVTGIAVEAIPGATPQATSCDTIAGTVRLPASSGQEQEAVYFEKTLFDNELVLGGDRAHDQNLQVRDLNGVAYRTRYMVINGPSGFSYLFTPMGSRNPSRYIIAIAQGDIVGISNPINGSSFDEPDKTLHGFGVSRLSPGQVTNLSDASKLTTVVDAFGTSARRVRVLRGGIKNTGSLIEVPSLPVNRTYFGGADKQYTVPTLASVRTSAVNDAGTAVTTATPKVTEACKNKVTAFISGQEKLPENQADRNLILQELALTKFSSVTSITALDQALRNVGVNVADYLNLLVMRDTEKDMANQLVTFKDLLGQAVAIMQGNPAGAEAAKNDSANRVNLCK